MPTIHLIHGFNVSDGGRQTVAKLAPVLKAQTAMETNVFSYGWVGLMGVWFLNPRIVKQLSSKIRTGDIGIGHSNGCVLLHMATFYGAPFSHLIYINPALTSNFPPLPQVGRIEVVHSDGDWAVMLASWLRALVPWVPIGDPLWGDMGARGHQLGLYEEDVEFKPAGFLARNIHRANLLAIRWPLFMTSAKVFVGIPFGLTYWLVFAPIEVALTFYFNNVVGKDPDMALTTSRIEDKKFVAYGLVLPFFFWFLVMLIFLLID